MTWTWIDWVIAAFILFAALQGLRRGLLAAVIGLILVGIAYLVASSWYRAVGELIRRYLNLDPSWAAVAGFVLVLLVLYGVLSFIAVSTLGVRDPPVPSRVFGLAVGALKGAVLAAALVIIALASPAAEPMRRDVERSTLAPTAVALTRDGLRAAAAVLPSTLQPFGAEEQQRL